MSSYNKLNGPYTSQNSELLKSILRDEWGFQGLVVTDWIAGDDAVAQMNAANDLLMPGFPHQREAIMKGIESGKLDKKVLDDNVARVLKLILMSPSYTGYKYSDQPDLKAHAQLARRAAADGIVLLKNDNALPLKKGFGKIAAFGNGSYDFVAGGTGSGDVNEAYTISLTEGLEQAGYPVNLDLKLLYQRYIKEEKAKQPPRQFFFELIPLIPENTLKKKVIQEQAEKSDVALITIGRNSGEFQDRNTKGDFYLTQAEKNMIKTVSEAFHSQGKKVILILNIGNVIETASWRGQVDAIVLAWQGGQEAGHAVTDVILGKVNPSGKLPTTFPITYEEIPSADNFPGIEIPGGKERFMGPVSLGKPAEVMYEEGIYVGYRYFNTFRKEVSFPFGYGLSYTTFDYDQVSLSAHGFTGSMDVSLRITNTGTAAGREVVQLYLAAPDDKMEKPRRELKGFAKTKMLQPGESQIVTFRLDGRSLSSWHTDRAAWIADSGQYTVEIGSSCESIETSATFSLAESIVVEQGSSLISPERNIKELSNKSK